MKKYIFAAFTGLLSLGFTACDVETDEEAGGTAVQNMAGFWDVTVDVVDEAGNVLAEDPYNMGTFSLMTYNTASNDPNQMWIDDQGNFWDFKYKIDVNYAARTFSSAPTYYNADMVEIAEAIAAGEQPVDRNGNPLAAETATITNGKILEGAARNVHGMPNDSIVFDVEFSDDEGTIYRIHGQRYWGTSPDVE